MCFEINIDPDPDPAKRARSATFFFWVSCGQIFRAGQRRDGDTRRLQSHQPFNQEVPISTHHHEKSARHHVSPDADGKALR